MDEKYDQDYREIMTSVLDNENIPVLWNVNVGHATPRCIIPFGRMAHVDADEQRIVFE